MLQCAESLYLSAPSIVLPSESYSPLAELRCKSPLGYHPKEKKTRTHRRETYTTWRAHPECRDIRIAPDINTSQAAYHILPEGIPDPKTYCCCKCPWHWESTDSVPLRHCAFAKTPNLVKRIQVRRGSPPRNQPRPPPVISAALRKLWQDSHSCEPCLKHPPGCLKLVGRSVPPHVSPAEP